MDDQPDHHRHDPQLSHARDAWSRCATLTGELGIGEEEYSWITGVFQVGIMLQPFAGYVMDLIGLKLGFGLFAIAWALITMLHGLATNWQILAALRGLMGFAEGSAQPGGMKAVAEWFPPKERGFAGGFYNIGASLARCWPRRSWPGPSCS